MVNEHKSVVKRKEGEIEGGKGEEKKEEKK